MQRVINKVDVKHSGHGTETDNSAQQPEQIGDDEQRETTDGDISLISPPSSVDVKQEAETVDGRDTRPPIDDIQPTTKVRTHELHDCKTMQATHDFKHI